ncbi:hypothetical protein FGRMN_315 [Fusarium graminum]|nr:hypothetical protein FGRMN_315 [Fusarium graminum]
MAEALGLASSIITLVGVAGKLGTSTVRLKRLWDEVQDVPANIRRCLDQLELLTPIIEDLETEFGQTRRMLQNDNAAKRSLEYSRKAAETLETLVRNMESQINVSKKSKRLAAQFKVMIKKDVVEEHQKQLHMAIQLVSLSQQTYLIALSRAQSSIMMSELRRARGSEQAQVVNHNVQIKEFHESVATNSARDGQSAAHVSRHFAADSCLFKVQRRIPWQRSGVLGGFFYKSYYNDDYASLEDECDKTQVHQMRLQLPPSLMQKAWDLQIQRAISGSTFQIRTWNTRPDDSMIFQLIRRGEIDLVNRALRTNKASLYDRNSEGRSLTECGYGAAKYSPPKCWDLAFLWQQQKITFGRGLRKLLFPHTPVRELTGKIRWAESNPAVALEMLSQGTAVARDFHTRSSTGELNVQGFATAYLHHFLNSPADMQDWRRLTRMMLAGGTEEEMSLLEVAKVVTKLWRRQFRINSFTKWIKKGLLILFEDLANAGIDLEEYMRWEAIRSREYGNEVQNLHNGLCLQLGMRLPEFGLALVILAFGKEPHDWKISWDPCVEELSGEFWIAIEDSQIRMPGTWVDDEWTEQGDHFNCQMGVEGSCAIKRMYQHSSEVQDKNTRVRGKISIETGQGPACKLAQNNPHQHHQLIIVMARGWFASCAAAYLVAFTAGASAYGIPAVSARAKDSGPKAVNISVPVDHFHNDTIYEPHSDKKFPLRYWFDAQYYRKGGPVIILAAGETSGEGRIPFLEHGILQMLANATGGIGVILEHRYYGTSFPVPDLKTENMRFLTTEQALADTAYFAENVKFPGLEEHNLTAHNTPYIIYGGSYAGAFAAFARKIYPDLFWGGISSSGVTAAVIDYWEYFEAARLFAPGDCAKVTQKLTRVIDDILLSKDKEQKKQLKIAFGLLGLQDDDFASAISRGIGGLQSNNWDPSEDAPDFGLYCASVSSDDILFASTRHLTPYVKKWLSSHGHESETKYLTNRFLNYIGYIRSSVESDKSGGCQGKTVNECYSIRGSINQTSLNQGSGRQWTYQTCTQWGYWQTGSGAPKGQLPMVSRLIDVEYSTIPCREEFNITTPPNVESINKLGGFNFSFPRVAIIDGEYDPWRAATPHKIGLPPRKSTVSEPYILIPYGVHHWDENGLDPDSTEIGLPPPAVAKAQQDIVDFTKAWLEEWDKKKGKTALDL